VVDIVADANDLHTVKPRRCHSTKPLCRYETPRREESVHAGTWPVQVAASATAHPSPTSRLVGRARLRGVSVLVRVPLAPCPQSLNGAVATAEKHVERRRPKATRAGGYAPTARSGKIPPGELFAKSKENGGASRALDCRPQHGSLANAFSPNPPRRPSRAQARPRPRGCARWLQRGRA